VNIFLFLKSSKKSKLIESNNLSMKIKRLPLQVILGLTFVLFLSSFMAFYPNGAPAAKTGSPGDGSNCTECHGGTASTVSGWITSNIPVQGYTPGQTYQITATNQITGSGKYGFEVSPQNVAGNLLGTLTAGTTSQLVGSGKYVTHTNATNSLSTWTFNWTAPAAGTGQVTFYGAFARNKPGPVRLSTLVVSEATAALPGAAGTITGTTAVCKNNSYNYSISSISGATSYVWTVPAGASISSGQGSTAITVNYGNSAVSGNVSVYGTNTAGNGAASNLAVAVSAAPSQPSAISGVSDPCSGSTQTYSVTNTSGVTFNWSVPSGSSIISGQGTNSISVTVGSTSGSISVAPSNTCGAGPNSSLAISITTLPGQSATPTGPDVVDLVFVSSSQYATTGASQGVTFQWEVSPANAGTIFGTGLTGTVEWNSSYLGMAQIRVKALGACGDGEWSLVKETEVLNTTGIIEGSSNINSSIYPNPSNGNFTVNPNWNKEQLTLLIMDASGREVFSKQVDGNISTNVEINASSGVYLLILTDGQQSVKKKLFIR
jgi:hypothetical protein